jgi:hypothetical protein
MEQTLALLGTLASFGAIPLSIYLFLKSKEAKFDKIKKEIVRTLTYQIGEEREITVFEIQTVINSKLRDNQFKTNAIKTDEIVEDLVSETISSPMIHRNRKDLILRNLRNVYIKGEILEKLDSIEFIDEDKLTSGSLEFEIKDLIAGRQVLGETLKNLGKGEKKFSEKKSTVFVIVLAAILALAGLVIGVITSVLVDQNPNDSSLLVELINQNKAVAIIIGIITSLIAMLLTRIYHGLQKDTTKGKERKKSDH